MCYAMSYVNVDTGEIEQPMQNGICVDNYLDSDCRSVDCIASVAMCILNIDGMIQPRSCLESNSLMYRVL